MIPMPVECRAVALVILIVFAVGVWIQLIFRRWNEQRRRK